jgi:hypothetical protein
VATLLAGGCADANVAEPPVVSRASSEAALRVIAEAAQCEQAMGDTRSVAAYRMDSKITRQETTYTHPLPDNRQAIRVETDWYNQSGRLLYRYATLTTSEGTWTLLPGLAIKSPDTTSAIQATLLARWVEDGGVAPVFTVSDYQEEGRQFRRVTSHYSVRVQLDARAAVGKTVGSKLPAEQLARLSPARREILINRESGLVVAIRDLNAAGAILREQRREALVSVEHDPARFEVPAASRRLYPETSDGFRQLIAEYEPLAAGAKPLPAAARPSDSRNNARSSP